MSNPLRKTRVIHTLDCGCVVLEDGARSLCPTCAAYVEGHVQRSNPDPLYTERAHCIALAVMLASKLGLHNGARDVQSDWPLVYIDLPTGQVSWHVSREDYIHCFGIEPEKTVPYPFEWDGHSPEEKYLRVRRFVWDAALSYSFEQMAERWNGGRVPPVLHSHEQLMQARRDVFRLARELVASVAQWYSGGVVPEDAPRVPTRIAADLEAALERAGAQ